MIRNIILWALKDDFVPVEGYPQEAEEEPLVVEELPTTLNGNVLEDSNLVELDQAPEKELKAYLKK